MVRRLSAGGRWIRTSGSAREALSRFDLLRFIYVQKDQSDGGARKAKAKCGQHASRGNCSTACSRKA